MEFNFKDKKSAKLFISTNSNLILEKEEDDFFINSISKDEEIMVSSNPLEMDYLETLSKKSIKKDEPIDIDSPIKKQEDQNLSTLQLNRIESKQNAILEILNCLPMPSVSSIKNIDIKEEQINDLVLNLKLFSSKLVILSTNSENKNIENLLKALKRISEYLLSNSFNIFMGLKSPINQALESLLELGMGNSELNKYLIQTENILRDIDSISKSNILEQNIFYTNLLLNKGYTLNAITLLNEATGIYIVESIKNLSDKISKYTYLIAEQNSIKLISNAKDFYINLFSESNETTNLIPLFPNHKVVKEMDEEIANKFRNLDRTAKNKGDHGLFHKFAFIISMVRKIRNSLAHGNMEINFTSLESEINSLNEDFKYISIKKNILKNKK
jgi:hypothetical protein